MKKDKLVALLNEIKGNPEVYMWNGFVEDFMDIDSQLHKDVLYKPLPRPENKKDSGKNNNKWEQRNLFVTNERMDYFYEKRTKPIVILNCKTRGKVVYDRMGKIEY